MKSLSNKGDTIVEVLIALVVISVVMTGAYVSSTRTLANSRQAQERGEAIKFVESQLEQIKANSTAAAGQTVNFCFAKDGTGIVVATDAKCKPGNIPGGYQMTVTPQVSGLYVVNANWDSASGNGKDQIKMSYKVN